MKKNYMNVPSCHRGATLIEVVLSMLIMTWVACGTLNGLGLMNQSFERAEKFHKKSLALPSIIQQTNKINNFPDPVI